MIGKFTNLTKEELKELIDSSNSISDVLTKIGLSSLGSGSRTSFYRAVSRLGLENELENLRKRTKIEKSNMVIKTKKLPFNKVFCENSTISRHHVKSRLIKEHLIDYKCSICNNGGEWNGQSLSLQLDHINGINNDNRLENLRFLCPNCHSQTDTFCGKHNKQKSNDFDKPFSKLESNKNYNETNQFNSLEKERWEIIEKSNIDFSKFGWVKMLSKLFNISENKAGNYVRLHYPDFYKNKCFVRN